jgi:hypothetical protein
LLSTILPSKKHNASDESASIAIVVFENSSTTSSVRQQVRTTVSYVPNKRRWHLNAHGGVDVEAEATP